MPGALRRFLRHRLALLGTVVLATIVILTIAGLTIGDLEPTRADIRAMRAAPSGAHALGTDLAGRDIVSRLIYGAATSLVVGFGAVTVYVLIGTSVGLLAGWRGGRTDQLLMRVTDAILAIPALLIIVAFVAAVGPSLTSVLVVIGLLGWPGIARLIRGQVLQLREAEFVTASRVIGMSELRILTRHLIPHSFGPLSVAATFGVSSAILLESAISFLGLGVQPPAASLGTMINEARSPSVLQQYPWMWVPPGVLIALIVLSVNFIGDGLRDALDPRSVRR